MALRILWNDKEVAILVDYYARFTNGELTRLEAIETASTELRGRAVQKGIKIDEQFRNTNGIAMQMSKVEDLFLGRKGRLSKAPQIFVDVVNLYLTDKKSYEKLLGEARMKKEDNALMQEEFITWLSAKVSPAQLSELYILYDEIESFCLSRRILKRKLFETTDVSQIVEVKKCIESNKIFRFMNRKKIGRMQSAINYYLAYIKEVQSSHEKNLKTVDKEAQKKCKKDASIAVEQERSESVEQVVSTESCTHNSTVINSNNPFTLDEMRDDKLNVEFENEHNYSFTRPVSISYFGDIYEVKSWSSAYICIAKLLYEDYPQIFMEIADSGYEKVGRIVVARQNQISQLTRPQSIAEGLFIETNRSAKDIVTYIKQLLDFCAVDYENVIITYRMTKETGKAESNSYKAEGIDSLLSFLENHDVEYVDNRNKDGCLWIKGEHELDNVVKYCKVNFSVIFHYKQEGGKTIDGQPGWWTKDQTIPGASTNEAKQDNRPLLQKRIQENADNQSFQRWMVAEQGMAETSSRSYASGVNNCEQLAIRLGLSKYKLYGVSCEEAEQTIEALIQTEDYQAANNTQHNRLRASLTKYMQYLSGDMTYALERQKRGAYGKEKFEEQTPMEDLIEFSQILLEKFPKGYRADSNLDLKRFISYYNAMYGTELDSGDIEIRESIKRKILHVGISYEGHVFAVDGLLSEDSKEHLLGYVRRSFSQGNRVIYYRALFDEFNDEFLGQRIYDEDMLRIYLVHECKGEYVFDNNYISLERNVEIDPKEEVKRTLVAHGSPMKTKEICEVLPHLPAERINWELHTNQEFICNTWNEYFHVSLIDLSDDELEDISQLILENITDRHFVSGNELIHMVNAKYPALLERFPQFSQIGLRDSIAYYLKDQFAFNGNVISSLKNQLSMSDVFAEFAKSHDRFTLDELNVLKTEMGSTIYFESVYENSLRVSKDVFVSKTEADFDVAKTDVAIASFCRGAYIPLANVTSFSAFPYAVYPWNIFLLEHYVASYSADYKLMHVGYNADKCVGAIVKKTAGMDDYNAVIADALAHSDINLNKTDALQYLCDAGYLARRKYSSIDQVLIMARAQKG